MHPILVTIFHGAGFIVLFILGEILYHKYKLKAEYTRKFAHISVGLLALTFPIFFISHWQVLILCFMFFVILLLAKKYNQLQHIHAVPRKTVGSYLYPPTVYACYFLGEKLGFALFFYIPILVMALSDPIAALSGSKWGRSISNREHSKTSLGSLMFLFSAIIASLSLYFSNLEIPILKLLFISTSVGIVGMIAEVLSYKGWDNFTIPLSIVVLMLIFKHYMIL